MKLGWTFDSLPTIVYIGYELKKDLSPRKNGNRESIWGNDNIIKISE